MYISDIVPYYTIPKKFPCLVGSKHSQDGTPQVWTERYEFWTAIFVLTLKAILFFPWPLLMEGDKYIQSFNEIQDRLPHYIVLNLYACQEFYFILFLLLNCVSIFYMHEEKISLSENH